MRAFRLRSLDRRKRPKTGRDWRTRGATDDRNGSPSGARISRWRKRSTTDAVKPWTKLRPPIGPSSPAQNIPASGAPPRLADTTSASWSGVENRLEPRPLQVNSRAASAWRRSMRWHRSSSAEVASRTWNCVVAPTSTVSFTMIAPSSGSAPSTLRTRKSPGPKSSLRSSMTLPKWTYSASSRRSASLIAIGHLLQALQRRLAGQLVDHVGLRFRDGVGVADGPAALRHDGGDLDTEVPGRRRPRRGSAPCRP